MTLNRSWPEIKAMKKSIRHKFHNAATLMQGQFQSPLVQQLLSWCILRSVSFKYINHQFQSNLEDQLCTPRIAVHPIKSSKTFSIYA